MKIFLIIVVVIGGLWFLSKQDKLEYETVDSLTAKYGSSSGKQRPTTKQVGDYPDAKGGYLKLVSPFNGIPISRIRPGLYKFTNTNATWEKYEAEAKADGVVEKWEQELIDLHKKNSSCDYGFRNRAGVPVARYSTRKSITVRIPPKVRYVPNKPGENLRPVAREKYSLYSFNQCANPVRVGEVK